MRELGRRPIGRLCCFALAVVTVLSSGLAAFGRSAPQGGPPTTTVAGTVYLADGTPAQGTLILTWPAFVTAGGTAIAAGTTNVTLGANGALSVALVSNAGATPAGVYYTVVYQLGPGQVKTEDWIVPTTSPASLASVIVTPGVGVAGQPVSMQYLNSQLAGVVHLSGAETVTGVKTFSSAPNVPAPMNPGDVANKSYVDSSVSNLGSGNFLPLAGGAMTGPITLPANPAAAMQASTKQYVDTAFSSSASLIAGLVPANELGSGTATSGSCLLGNGASATWGACGGGSGSGNVSTSPSANQSIAQPGGTQFSTNNFANIRYVTANWNWAQTPADNLATPGNLTIHLSPCPLGMDTTPPLANPPANFVPVNQNYYAYKVYISGTGTPEAAMVTGGTCTPGAASGTITATTVNAHTAGYVVGSASSGIQEAINDAWTTDGMELASPYVKLASNTIYNVYASVFLRGRGPFLDGSGAQIACYTRDRCLFVGISRAYPAVHYGTLANLYMNPALTPSQQIWSNISSISAASAGSGYYTYTITTPGAHAFLIGDTIDCEYSTTGVAGHIDGPVLSTGFGSTQFEITQNGGAAFSAGAYTFGFCHILNAAIEDNSDHLVVDNFQISQAGNVSSSGVFNFGFVNDNDQAAALNQPGNRSSLAIDPSYPVNAFIYQRGDQGMAGITYIENAEFTNVNCFTGASNGMAIKHSVCQGFPVFGVRYFGGLQPATIDSVYQESTAGSNNPLYGYPAAMGYLFQGGTGHKLLGTFPVGGFVPTFNCSGGTATTARNYFVIPKNGSGSYGSMAYIGSSNPANCGGVGVPLLWPAILGVDMTGASTGTVTYDVVYTTATAPPPIPGATTSYVEINSTGVSCNTSGMCSVSDPQTGSSTYTLPAQTNNFFIKYWFWPESYVMNTGTSASVLLADQIATNPNIATSLGLLIPSVIATQCNSAGQPQYRSQVWVECNNPPSGGGAGSVAQVWGQADASGNGPIANSKGILNLGKQPSLVPNDLITLADSNLSKTLTLAGERPANDAGDLALGLDQGNGLAFRAGTSISSYINAIPTGANYLERLTGAAKTFNVPVAVNGNLAVTNGTVTLPITGSGNQCLHVSSTGVVSGAGVDCGSGGSGTVNSGSTSQVALYAGNEAAVSGDSALTDNGTTLNYGGSGGIAASTGTFSGNVTVNGQLLVAGPWMVSSPIPGSPMGPAGAGTSALGISNDGNFYISANGGTPQKVSTTATTSYFSNLFQEDANDLGAYNGTTAQNLHVYSSYTNSSTWTRTSVGYDSTDGYSVLRSESSPSGGAPGLGFWINSGLKWVIDATSNFKPWTDQTYNIGSFSGSSGVGLRPATVYAAGNSTSGSGFELGRFASNSYELCNDTTNGTVINGLATLTSAGCATKPMSAVTTGVVGVVIANAGTSGTVTLVRTGSAYCSFDGAATVVGDYVVASATANGGAYPLCHDAGSTLPSGQQILGRVLQATSGSTTAQMFFDMPGSSVGPNSVSSVFGRTGAVVAVSGDYSVSQITGAAPAASPTFTGTVTVPDGTTNTSSGYTFAHALTLPSGSTGTTQSAGDNSTKVATTAYVRSEAQFAWSCPVGGTTSSAQYCNWTLPAGLTITGFDLAASTAPAGCTTYPVVQVWDGTAGAEVGSFSITTSSGTNFYTQVTGSTNVASGHQLRLKVTTAASGCSTNAANVVVTVTYQMQN